MAVVKILSSDPWVVMFDEFLSAEESEEVQKLGHVQGFKESYVGGGSINNIYNEVGVDRNISSLHFKLE